MTETSRSGTGGRRTSRRTFLRRIIAGAGLGGIAYGAVELSSAGAVDRGRRPATARRRQVPSPPRPVQLTALPGGAVVPTASWVQKENARPGTTDWVVTGHQVPRSIEGFADVTSAMAGTDVTLFVNTVSPSFHVEAYRMGYYQGLGARLVWTSDDAGGVEQPPPTVTPGVSTVQCAWAPSMSVPIDRSWPPGAYLFKLVGTSGEQQYIPLCIRDDASTAAFVVQHGVTTWQAYNLWGGYSLYNGLTAGGLSWGQSTEGKEFGTVPGRLLRPPLFAGLGAGGLGLHRQRIPPDLPHGAARSRRDLLDRRRSSRAPRAPGEPSVPVQLGSRRVLVTSDARWRHAGPRSGREFRLPGGQRLLPPDQARALARSEPNRLQVCYKSAAEDPEFGVDDAVVTAPEWAASPTLWPESQLIGSMYQDVGADADLVVADPWSWIWAGTGVTAGQKLPHVVQGEYDRFDPSLPGPRNVEIAAHSPVVNRGPGRFSDITWYTTYGGGGVFATGNAAWVNKLAHTTAFPTNVVPAAIPGVTEILLRVMENVYAVLGVGPGSSNQQSQGNWAFVAPGAPPPTPAVTA